MKIDLTESDYRTLLRALRMAEAFAHESIKRQFPSLRDSLRVRWERAADEEQVRKLRANERIV